MATVGYGSNGKVSLNDQFFHSADTVEQAKKYRPDFSTDKIDTFVGLAYNKTLKVAKPESADPTIGSDMGSGVPSLVNRYSLFQFKGFTNNSVDVNDYKDGPESIYIKDKRYLAAKNPTATQIITFINDEASAGKVGRGMTYSFADFIYCKYYGRISNNYMITLRRFAAPVNDNIWDPMAYDGKSSKYVDNSQFDIARAITYMSEAAGNKLEEILSMNFKYKWEDIESSMQVAQSKANGLSGSQTIGIGTSGFSLAGALTSTAAAGNNTTTADQQKAKERAGFDDLKETYPNYIEGPLNVIKNMVIQGQGLTFEHEIKLKFEFDLRAIDTVNPKMALLDIMANLLVLTYSNAPWWGGGHRFLGSGNFGSPLGDRGLLESGDIGGYLKSVQKSVGGLMSAAFGKAGGGFDLESVIGGLGNIAGDMLGGWLGENLNTPQGAQAIQALLSGEATGKWHLTIGNPLNPIAMVGNLTLQDTTMVLKGPLGRDDFPTILEVNITLKPGRSRDKSDIESMFNSGRGRLYQIPEGFADVLNTSGKEPARITGYGASADAKATNNGTGKPTKITGSLDTILGSNWNETTAEDLRDNYTDGKKYMAARLGSPKEGVAPLYDKLVKYTSG